MILATRPLEVAPPEYDAIVHANGARFVPLDVMTPEETQTLLCQRLGVKQLAAEIVTLVFAKAEGNPFFAEEVAYALRDTGLIVIDNDECRVSPTSGGIDAIRLPDTLQGIVTSRVDRLSAPQQLTLKVASVVGHTFVLDLLLDLHPLGADAERLVNLLEPLVHRDLLKSLASAPDRTYGFRHNITQEVVYNLMLFAQRRELHGKAAQALESRHAAALSPYYSLLAHHWTRAEEWTKAIDYLECAGKQALDRFANETAIAAFTAAIHIDEQQSLHTPSERRTDWQRCLAHANYGAGHLDRCADHAGRALAMLGWPMPASLAGTAAGLLHQVAIRFLQTFFPERTRIAATQERAARLSATRLQTRLTECYLFAQNIPSMLYSVVRELNLADPAGQSAELGRAYGTMAAILGTIPLTQMAEASVRRAEENAAIAEPLDRAFIYTRIAVFGIYGAQWERCDAWLSEAQATSSRLDDGKTWQDATTMWAIVDHYRGAFARSRASFAAMHAAAALRGVEQGQQWGRLGEGMALVRLGRAAESLPLFEAVMPWVTKTASPPEAIWALGMKALAHAETGDMPEALAHAERALALIESARPAAYWTQQSTAAIDEVYWMAARQAPDAARKAEMMTRFRRAVRSMRRFAGIFPFGAPPALLWQGMLQLELGRRGNAANAFLRCRQVSARLHMPFEEGRAHLALIELTEGAERERHRAEAEARLTACGVPVTLR